MNLLNSLIIFILIFAMPSSGYATMESFVQDYLHNLEKNGEAVFYAKCSSSVNQDSKALVIINSTTSDGIMVIFRESNVVNIAELKITDKGIDIGESQGGIATREKIIRLVDEIMRSRFHFLLQFSITEVMNAISPDKCINIDP